MFFKHALVTLFFFSAFSSYASDSLRVAQESNNYIEIDVAGGTCTITISDSILKRQVIEAIGKRYRLAWTKEELDNSRNLAYFPTHLKQLDYKIRHPEGNEGYLPIYDYTYDLNNWIEELNRLGNTRAEALWTKAKKTKKNAKLQDFKPWFIVYYHSQEEKQAVAAKLATYGIRPVLQKVEFADAATGFFDDVPPPPPPPAAEPQKNDRPLDFTDEPAEFPGGKEALMEYMKKNLIYPASALEAGIEGKAFVRFVVKKDGDLSNIVIVKGVTDCKECDIAAIRMVKGMPNWIPGKNAGQPVDSYFNLPVIFKLTK